MNTERLYEILAETTIQLRKGDEIVYAKNGSSISVYAMPHESEVISDDKTNIEKVDCFFKTIGVKKDVALKHREELVGILRGYPQPERLASGPNYIEVGAEIGDQGAAFQLFALGQVLNFWKVVTPTILGMSGERAELLAGMGFIMITGFKE